MEFEHSLNSIRRDLMADPETAAYFLKRSPSLKRAKPVRRAKLSARPIRAKRVTPHKRSNSSDPRLPGFNSSHWLYSRFCNVVQRCTNPKCPSFKHYGGRGISIADEWRSSVIEFAIWSLNNGAMPHLELDRIDNDGPYSPSNCRWITKAANLDNRRNTVRLSDGSTLTERLNRSGVDNIPTMRALVFNRMALGYSPDDAVSLALSVKSDTRRRHFMPDGTPLLRAPRASGLSDDTIHWRVNNGWSFFDALSIPPGAKRASVSQSLFKETK